LLTIEELVKYRHQHDSLIERSVRTTIDGFGGQFEAQIYINTVEYAEHIALIKGDVATDEAVLVRMHAVNVVDDLLGTKQANHALIQKSMEALETAGRGVIVLIRDPRPTVVSETILNKQQKIDNSAPLQDHETASAQRLMEYGVGAEILADLGVKNVILLSNSPKKSIVGLDAFGLTIVGQQSIE
jgi:3,4-dihydroxy 2-butanone 4-phosphate synthase/GTP cyclohydrolase II